jgi:hypothetical protein
VAFEPDAREAGALDCTQRSFRRFIFCPVIAVPERSPDQRAVLHLTQSPQCSSLLRPKPEALCEWTFADFFVVNEAREVAARTLADALAAEGIARIDWLKCDTQGLDLKLFQSLALAWRERLLAVEFEPGLIDSYEGEDKLAHVLLAMEREPFWLQELKTGGVPRARLKLVREAFGPDVAPWVRRLGPCAPGWANLRFLRDVALVPESLDRRAHLLAWVFAMLSGQPGQALTVANLGGARYPGRLFPEMCRASVRALRWAMLRRFPRWAWERMTR